MEYLVSSDWLHKHFDDPDLVIIDCTNFAELNAVTGTYFTSSGRGVWEVEHIRGSRFADFSTEMSSDNLQYRNALPTPFKLKSALEQMGVGDGARVVLYDSTLSMWAARVWWMLRWIGFDNAVVLDGGLQSWKAAGGDTTSVITLHRRADLSVCLRSDLFVTKETVLKALDETAVVIVDALERGQFDGRKSELGLCGHIPGAVNIPAENLLDPVTGCYLPKEYLADRLPASPDARTIVYCGSGIAAASVAFSMCRVGFGNVAIYMPGFQEWVHDASLPQSN